MNMQTNKLNRLASRPSGERYIGTIIELIDNVKGNAVFDFTKELESAETPE